MQGFFFDPQVASKPAPPTGAERVLALGLQREWPFKETRVEVPSLDEAVENVFFIIDG